MLPPCHGRICRLLSGCGFKKMSVTCFHILLLQISRWKFHPMGPSSNGQLRTSRSISSQPRCLARYISRDSCLRSAELVSSIASCAGSSDDFSLKIVSIEPCIEQIINFQTTMSLPENFEIRSSPANCIVYVYSVLNNAYPACPASIEQSPVHKPHAGCGLSQTHILVDLESLAGQEYVHECIDG